MIALRKGLPLVAGAAMLFGAGTASAQIDLNDWVLSLDNLGGIFTDQQTLGPGENGVNQALFISPARVVTTDADGSGTLSVGDTQLVRGQGQISAFSQNALTQFNNTTNGNPAEDLTNLQDFEITFTFELNEVITSVTGDNVGFDHTGGSLQLFVDSVVDFDGAAGTGAGASATSVQIAEFEVVPGALGGNINTANNDGNVDIVFQATSIAAGWLFTGDGTDIASLLDPEGDPILIAFSDSNFDICTPDGVECQPGLFQPGGIYGDDLPDGFDIFDFFAVEDGSIDLALLPEPGTMAIFGLGLLGLGIAVRRRQRTTA